MITSENKRKMTNDQWLSSNDVRRTVAFMAHEEQIEVLTIEIDTDRCRSSSSDLKMKVSNAGDILSNTKSYIK